jgi:ribonuclease Z
MPRFRWFFLLALFVTLGPAPVRAFDGIRVTLLGTGGLAPSIERFGPATLVEAGDEVLLFDCGRGAVQRLVQAKVALADVTAVFLTHLGAESTVGLPDLWLTGWLRGRPDALPVYGPEGTEEMMRNLERAFRAGIQSRVRGQSDAVTVDAHDIAENVVYRSEEVTVTAVVVDRGTLPAYAYRVDLHHRHSMLISAAARYSANLVQSARGLRLMVQEVGAADPELMESARVRDMLSAHSSPEDAARMFREARPYLAVYAPVVLFDVTEDQLMRRTHAAYPGIVELGRDMMVIEIQEEVQVRGAPSGERRRGE